MSHPDSRLPAGVTVFERGWLSANNVLFCGEETTLVDSGYCTHAHQTVGLVSGALDRPLDFLLNTHLHSDHCGGNAALQDHYPSLRTLIPPGQADQVRHWDRVALTYQPTGQECPQFKIEGTLMPGTERMLGHQHWQVHAAPGHDVHSVVFFEPMSRTLVSADALWENGFGVVFQELEGEQAFDAVATTLDLIERLDPLVVIPGHGRIFSTVQEAIAVARRRLDAFQRDPAKHATHAAKVLLKFKLLELQKVRIEEFESWARNTPYFSLVHTRWFPDAEMGVWLKSLTADLERSGAAQCADGYIANA